MTASRRGPRLLAVVATVIAAFLVWLVIETAFGVDLRAPTFDDARDPQDVGPLPVIVTSALAALAGWGLLAFLERLTSRARVIWVVLAVLGLALSLGGPMSGSGVGTSNRVGLAALHLTVAAVIIPSLYRTSTQQVPATQEGASR